MTKLIAPDYGEQFLFPPALEDWVAQDHPARFLREFVDQLDLAALGFVIPAAVEGRPPYAPSLLLKIWLYGYFHRIRSTRKLEAACSGPKGWSKEYMEKLLAQLDGALKDIELKVIEENPQNPTPGYRLPAGLAQRQALREEIKKGLAQLQSDGRGHYHPAEPEARRMKVGDTNRYAYNAQAIADEKEKIIVACEVNRQETDTGQLTPMIEQARQNLGVAATGTLTVADTGYGSGADLQSALDKGLKVLAPPPEGKPAKDNPYATQRFNIDPVAHTVVCPQSRSLDYEGQTTKNGQRVKRFRCHHQDCPVREHCTNDPKGRQIEVWPHQATVQAMRQQLQQALPLQQWRQRSEIIEPRFAQLKQHGGFRRWTMWGLESGRTQWALLCATLNLRVLYKKWQSNFKTGLAQVMALASHLKSHFKTPPQPYLPIPSFFAPLFPSRQICGAYFPVKTF